MTGIDLSAQLAELRRLGRELLGGVELPPVVRATQRLDAPRLEDVEASARAETLRAVSGRPPGPVAVGVGSRGIANLEGIVRACVGALREAGWSPFIVPAMGSHGAATAEGQAQVLAGYGITEERVGAPVRATMETVVVGEVLGVPLHLDRFAFEAGAVFPVSRVKPHTSFRGPVESGPAKMTCIGLGKQAGAAVMHSDGSDGLTRRVPAAPRVLEGLGLLAGALAIVENQRDETALLAGLDPAGVGGEAEARLLERARELMPRIPFEAVDVLLVGQMGKDISGTGMDTNVINRLRIVGREEPAGPPRITAIAVLALTAATHGNAMGIGNADYAPAALAGQLDLAALYANSITAGGVAIERPKLPMFLADARDCVRAAAAATGRPAGALRLCWIRDTLHTETMWISPALLEEATAVGLDVHGVPAPLPFDSEGNLPVLPWLKPTER